MKRFRSQLQPVQRVQHQLLRVAELKLAEVQAALRMADDAIEQLKQLRQSTSTRFSLKFQARQLSSGRQLQVAQGQISALADEIATIRQHRNDLESERIRRETIYRQLRARCDGVDQLVDLQQADHRRQQLRYEQNELDEMCQLAGDSKNKPTGALAISDDEGTDQ